MAYYEYAAGRARLEAGPRKGEMKTQKEYMQSFIQRISNPKTVRRMASDYRRMGLGANASNTRKALSGPASLINPGQLDRAQRRLKVNEGRAQKRRFADTRSLRQDVTDAVVQRAKAWYSGQRSGSKPGPLSKPRLQNIITAPSAPAKGIKLKIGRAHV